MANKTEENSEEIIRSAAQGVEWAGAAWNPDTVSLKTLSPDGSLRRFFRLQGPENRTILVIRPHPEDENGLREAYAAWKIGSHLFALGIPVPEIYGFDRASGTLYVEDLGNERLHDRLQSISDKEVTTLYLEAVCELARMQVRGVEGFSSSWCWDTPRYDAQLMLERESGYFLQALCLDLLGISIDRQALTKEFQRLARRASRADSHWFLHRDFQSRNLMLAGGRIRIIDFQGGRRGPLGYDLASLLLDPYAALTPRQQQIIYEGYLEALQGYIPVDRERFAREYLVLALQRTMQMLGAFAFLSHRRNKPFFARFIPPALQTLNSLLAKPEAADYAALRGLVRRIVNSVATSP